GCRLPYSYRCRVEVFGIGVEQRGDGDRRRGIEVESARAMGVLSRLSRTKRRHAVPPIAPAGLHGRPSQIVRLALSKRETPASIQVGVSHFVDVLDPILAGGSSARIWSSS